MLVWGCMAVGGRRGKVWFVQEDEGEAGPWQWWKRRRGEELGPWRWWKRRKGEEGEEEEPACRESYNVMNTLIILCGCQRVCNCIQFQLVGPHSAVYTAPAVYSTCPLMTSFLLMHDIVHGNRSSIIPKLKMMPRNNSQYIVYGLKD